MTQIGSEYIERYPEWRESLPGKGLAWLTEMRADAFEHFAERGFPTRRTEAWKYTNLAPLAKGVFAPKASVAGKGLAAAPAHGPNEMTAHLIVFVNGRLEADGSALNALPKGVRLITLGRGVRKGAGPDRNPPGGERQAGRARPFRNEHRAHDGRCRFDA